MTGCSSSPRRTLGPTTGADALERRDPQLSRGAGEGRGHPARARRGRCGRRAARGRGAERADGAARADAAAAAALAAGAARAAAKLVAVNLSTRSRATSASPPADRAVEAAADAARAALGSRDLARSSASKRSSRLAAVSEITDFGLVILVVAGGPRARRPLEQAERALPDPGAGDLPARRRRRCAFLAEPRAPALDPATSSGSRSSRWSLILFDGGMRVGWKRFRALGGPDLVARRLRHVRDRRGSSRSPARYLFDFSWTRRGHPRRRARADRPGGDVLRARQAARSAAAPARSSRASPARTTPSGSR